MDSSPPPPDGDPTPLRGTRQLAAGLRARRQPLVVARAPRQLSGIGDLGRAAQRFGSLAFQSASVRRFLQAQHRGTDVGQLLVRPPDYWSGHRDEDLGVSVRRSTGDAALDRLVARMKSRKQDTAAAVRLHRGLPSTVHRRTHSVAGPMTAPGGVARRLQPTTFVPPPNPANSPQTAASRTAASRTASPATSASRSVSRAPRPTSPSRSGTRRDTDPTRPTAVAPGRSSVAPVAPVAPGERVGAPAGQPIAVRRLLSGWQSPTAWRSVQAAPGLRLLPAGRNVLPTTWPGSIDAPAAASPASTPTSWSETVRRAAAAAETRVGTSGLPVGSPAAVVREHAGEPVASSSRRAAPSEAPRSSAGEAHQPPSTTRPAPGSTRPAPLARPLAASPASSRPGRAPGTSQAGVASAADSWSVLASSPLSPRGTGAGGAGVVVRRRAVPGSTDVELTAWTPAPTLAAGPGAPTPAAPAGAEHQHAAAGFRPTGARRPGRWLARAGVQRVPMGPLGPVRWAARADEPIVARGAVGDPPGGAPTSWAARVAAAASAMTGGPLGGGTAGLPVAGGLTVVRGGAASGADTPAAAVRRQTAHPAARRLRLVPTDDAAAPSGPAGRAPTAGAPVGRAATATPGDGAGASAATSTPSLGATPTTTASTTSTASGRATSSSPSAGASDGATPAATSSGSIVADQAAATRRSADPGSDAPVTTGGTWGAAPATWVGRATASAPFVSAPGAVAAHGLPAARASLVGVTAGGAAPGRPATPGALARLAHGQPVRRRPLPELAPPAMLLRASGPAIEATAGGRRLVPAASTATAAPTAIDSSTTTAAPTAAGRGMPGASGAARSFGLPASPAALARRRATAESTSSPAARGLVGRTGGAAAMPPTSTTPSWSQRVARVAQAAAPWFATATGGAVVPASVASLRGLPVAPALVRRATQVEPRPSPRPEGRHRAGTATSGANPSRSTPTAPVGAPNAPLRSRTPHGVHATVARQRVHARAAAAPSGPPTAPTSWAETVRRRVAAAGDVPGRVLPGARPSPLRPLVAPPAGATVVARAAATPGTPAGPTWSQRVAAAAAGATAPVTPATPARPKAMRPSSPGSAAHFDQVLRSSAEPVRTQPLPVRFRPLAERIVGRMPVTIATGVPSQRALAAVGTTAATTGSTIHLPKPPDGSVRSTSILAHELTHVAAASPVARFHGGAPSIEETAATQVERIVARAARSTGAGRGPTPVPVKDLPVAGFVGVKGSAAGPAGPAGPPPPASAVGGASPGTTSAEAMAARLGGGGSSSPASGTVARSVDPAAGVADTVHRSSSGTPDRIVRRRSGASASAIERELRAAENDLVLSDDQFDAILTALEDRLLAELERRGGLWRGGF